MNSAICPNIGGGFHYGFGDPGTIRTLETIHLKPGHCVEKADIIIVKVWIEMIDKHKTLFQNLFKNLLS